MGPAARTSGIGLRPWLPVLRGLLLAAPIVLLFALLFASADAVFAALARSALTLPVDIDLDDLAERAIVVTAVAWAAAGLLALAAGRLPLLIPGAPAGPPAPPRAARSLGAASAADMARGAGPLGTVEAATILLVVDALFAAFVLLQLAYLFGGRDTLAVARMTYADYARHGFFELVAVAVLAGLLVVCLDLAVRWRSARPARGGPGAAGADGGRARVRVRPAAVVPGRLRLDRAAVRGGGRDRLAGGRAGRDRLAARHSPDALDAARAGDPRRWRRSWA